MVSFNTKEGFFVFSCFIIPESHALLYFRQTVSVTEKGILPGAREIT